MKKYNKAFTLIELLVVVLIIGVLSAIALPQYRKSVEKSKSVQAITLLKAIDAAQMEYYLANGQYARQFSELSVNIPWTGNTKGHTYGEVTDTLSNEDWSIQLLNYQSNDYITSVTRLTGPYKGSGFQIPRLITSQVPGRISGSLECFEKHDIGVIFTDSHGSYCQKIFGSTLFFSGSCDLYHLN